MNILSWIAERYISNCDESWEHSYGVKFDTLDNPGWDVKIDLMETPLENRAFEVYEIDNGDMEEKDNKKASRKFVKPLNILWSGQWESNPPLKLGKLSFYR